MGIKVIKVVLPYKALQKNPCSFQRRGFFAELVKSVRGEFAWFLKADDDLHLDDRIAGQGLDANGAAGVNPA